MFSEARLLENLVWISAAFSITVVLSTLSLITAVVPASTASTAVMTVLAWLKLILTLLPPYIFAGMAISVALTRSPWPVGLVYGVDLLGAASGCLVVLVLLNWADAISVLIAIGTFEAVAAVCFGAAPGRPKFHSQPGNRPISSVPAPGAAGLRIWLGRHRECSNPAQWAGTYAVEGSPGTHQAVRHALEFVLSRVGRDHNQGRTDNVGSIA